MKRKLVQAGGSLAVTLPAEVVHEFKLRKGMEVDVSVHPQTGAVTIRPGVQYFRGRKSDEAVQTARRGDRQEVRRELPRPREVTEYLSVEQVLALHAFQFKRYGGASGLIAIWLRQRIRPRER